MSSVEHRPGSIYRIALENFVTFKQVELYPGRNLNLIIGPNGTGKSTFICAIVLGLCGKTNVIGRAKKIGEYVRRGSESATIEIELFNKKNEQNIIITRNFNVENTSLWSINGSNAKENEIRTVVSSLNIRVDNLCQLLPQDRVQDFAKMDPQELLKSTQLAVSGPEAVTLLEKLIQLKNSSKHSTKTLSSKTQQLLEEEQLNARLETIITNMIEIKKIKKELDVCEKKKIWSEYDELKSEVDACIDDIKAINKTLQEYEKRYEPCQKELDSLDQYLKTYESKRSLSMKRVSILKNKMNSKAELCNKEEEKIDEIKSDLKSKITQQHNRLRDIEQAKTELAKLESDRDNLIKCGDEDELKSQISELMLPIANTNKNLDDLRTIKTHIQYDLDSKIVPQIKQCQIKINQLQDIGNKRLELLRNLNEDSYKALLWFRENKSLFKNNVYEPMMFELNFTDPKFTKYLENTVAVRDLTAFTFEDSNDMNFFIKKVRSELKFNMVNAVCSQPSNRKFFNPIDIGKLKHLGFYAYLNNVINGPDAIIHFLCKQYGIHNIPIGNETTYEVSQRVPNDVNFFYSANHRFVIKISKYSGAKSVSTSEIRPAKVLANAIDNEAIQSVKEQINSLLKQQELKLNKLQNTDKNMSMLSEKLNKYIAEKQKFHQFLDQVKTIKSRVRMQQSKVQYLENQASLDIEKEKKESKLKLLNCVSQMLVIQTEIHDISVDLTDELIKSNIITIRCKEIHNQRISKRNELSEMKNGATNIKSRLLECESKKTTLASKAVEKLSKAKHATGKFLPHQKEFPLKKEFSTLPATVEELDEHIAMLQAKIHNMDSGDEHVLQEYKNRTLTIEKLRSEIENLSNVTKKSSSEIDDLKNKWLKPLEEQVHQINKKFGDMFTQLGCAGEIKLTKYGTEDEFDKYGISILVKFREEEKLTQLTHRTQSGGERALATALYLMALQQLSQAPFRCVDEINQGMDAINERKMFQLLVKITSETDASSQYFLLTPKLLYGLEFPKYIKIHTIMNGIYSLKYRKWNFKSFMEKSRKSHNKSY